MIINKFKLLNAWQIKLLLVLLMLLNHLHFVYGFLSDDLNYIFVVISRCVAPMFGYLAVQGIFHTKDKNKFVLRLWIWTLIVTIGNYLIGTFLTNSVLLTAEKESYLLIGTNICITLALIVTGLVLIDKSKKANSIDKIYYYLFSIMFLIQGLLVEWGIILVPFMLVSYLFNDNKLYRNICYLLIAIYSFLLNYETLFVLVFPLILLYDGTRGPNTTFTKYFFYAFYPIHLWIIAIINYFILTK